MDVALVVVAVFSAFVLAVGFLAQRISGQTPTLESQMLGSRKLSFGVGICTLTATWVGGGYICGTAEIVRSSGLIHAQAPWGFGLSLILGGIFFAEIMRKRGYVTLLDPFAERYGSRVAAVLYIPALIGEILSTAAVLAALGFTVAMILDVPFHLAVLGSAIITISYTMVGGFLAVAYTDVLQLIMIFIGLFLVLPFGLSAAGGFDTVVANYFAKSSGSKISELIRPDFPLGTWTDTAMLLVLGGIPWGTYFQRVLACPDPKSARRLSIYSGCLCFVLAGPPILIGMVGATVDWSTLGLETPAFAMTLPAVIKYLTPDWVTVVGAAVISAAVVSSMDSSILSASSMFTWNIVRPLDRAGRLPMPTVLRVTMAVIGGLATCLALATDSIYALWYLCADLVYVVLFPQLVAVLYFRQANSTGALVTIIYGLTARLMFGVPTLGLPAMVPDDLHSYPFRSMIMLSSLALIPACSWLTSARDPSTHKNHQASSLPIRGGAL